MTRSLNTNPSDFQETKQAIAPDAYVIAAEADGLDIDTLGYRWAEYIVNLGAAADTTAVLNIDPQEADDDGTGAADTYADLPAALMPANFSGGSDASAVRRLEYDLGLRKRWMRLQHTLTVANWDYGAVVVLSGPKDTEWLPAKATAFAISIVAAAYA